MVLVILIAEAKVSTYPNYAGELDVRGSMRVFPKSSTVTTVAFTLAGLEPSLVGSAHIHEGTTCADALGHYFNPAITDPWNSANCPITADAAGVAIGSFDLAFGYDTMASLGRTVPYVYT